jgi:hypothetical protein
MVEVYVSRGARAVQDRTPALKLKAMLMAAGLSGYALPPRFLFISADGGLIP